jgi:hypothetical protein
MFRPYTAIIRCVHDYLAETVPLYAKFTYHLWTRC